MLSNPKTTSQPRLTAEQLFDRLCVFTHGELWRRSGNHVECVIDCPSCKHTSTKADLHFSFSVRGAKCFRCGYTAGLRALADLLGYTESAPYTASTTPTPPERGKAYVQDWKRDPESYISKFQEAPDLIPLWEAYRPFDLKSMIQWRLGVGVLPSSACKHRRLVYPVIIGGKIVGIRGRAISCACTKDCQPGCKLHCKKWLQAGGSDAQLFNQDAVVLGCTVIIIEQPVDIMLFSQFLRTNPQQGQLVAVAGTAGAGTWKPEWSHFLSQRKVASVLVWLDNDLVGDPNPKTAR